MSERRRDISVELAEMIGPSDEEGQRYTCALRAHAGAARIQIGTRVGIGIALPRRHHPAIGQRHLGILFAASGGITLESYQPRHQRCLVDGQNADGASIATGEHLLELGPDRFRLRIEVGTKSRAIKLSRSF